MATEPTVPAAFCARSAFTIVMLPASLAGVPAFFLPFVDDSSPLATLAAIGSDRGFFNLPEFAWIGAPFLLAPLATLALLRWIVRGNLLKAECVAAWTLTTVAAASICWFFVSIFFESRSEAASTFTMLFVAAFALPALVGLALAARLARCVPATVAALVALEAVYAIDVILCLTLFSGFTYQSGAYCALVTAAVFTVHAAVVVTAARRARAATVPAPRALPTGARYSARRW